MGAHGLLVDAVAAGVQQVEAGGFQSARSRADFDRDRHEPECDGHLADRCHCGFLQGNLWGCGFGPWQRTASKNYAAAMAPAFALAMAASWRAYLPIFMRPRRSSLRQQSICLRESRWPFGLPCLLVRIWRAKLEKIGPSNAVNPTPLFSRVCSAFFSAE